MLPALKREINCGERYVSIEASWLKRLKGVGFAFDCVSVKTSLWPLAGFVIGETVFKAYTVCKKASLHGCQLEFKMCLFCHSCILALSVFFFVCFVFFFCRWRIWFSIEKPSLADKTILCKNAKFIWDEKHDVYVRCISYHTFTALSSIEACANTGEIMQCIHAGSTVLTGVGMTVIKICQGDQNTLNNASVVSTMFPTAKNCHLQ